MCKRGSLARTRIAVSRREGRLNIRYTTGVKPSLEAVKIAQRILTLSMPTVTTASAGTSSPKIVQQKNIVDMLQDVQKRIQVSMFSNSVI